MRIWHENYTLEHVITLRDNNINKHLGIKFTDITDNSISATMPVEDITRQSRGVLHGGASCVLAESLGSIASNLCCLLYTSPSPRDRTRSRMPSSA